MKLGVLSQTTSLLHIRLFFYLFSRGAEAEEFLAINPGLHVERKRGNIKPADHSNQPLQRGFGSLYSLWVGGGPDQSLLHLQPAACRFNSLHICEVPRVNSGEIISRWQGTQTLPLRIHIRCCAVS